MPTDPSLPGSLGLSLLADVTDPCAIFDRVTGAPLWQNRAWTTWSEMLAALEVVTDVSSHSFFQQQLAVCISTIEADPVRENLRWATTGIAAFDTPIVLHPYPDDAGRQLVAVLALAPRPVVDLPLGCDLGRPRDPLTGLPGRDAIVTRLEQFSRAKGLDANFALLFLDLDGFKTINDQYGHLAGDRVLARVAARLAKAIRDEDLIARYGGDEFVVLVSGIQNRSDLQPVTSRLRQAAEELVDFEGKLLQVSTSIGSALSVEGWSSVAELISKADRQMYAEKQQASSSSIQ